jgi:2-oxoglutarate/2-oxoacid ferredoxin oxidoreductase subunit beta
MITTDVKFKINDLKSGVKPIWCPGCGDFGVLNSVFRTVIDLSLDPSHVAIISGIGCSGRFPAFAKAYGFHGVHGRALPLATGTKLANPDLTVFVVGGDGDAFSIGAGHLPHAARRNVDINYVVMDNNIYGLTKGQPSATSPMDVAEDSMVTKKGRRKGMSGLLNLAQANEPINPIAMALAYDASFVARAFSAQPRELAAILKAAVLHPGFSFVQVISPCTTFYDTYNFWREIAEPLPEDHDPTDRAAAFGRALEIDKGYLGIFYQKERPSFEEEMSRLVAEPTDEFAPTAVAGLLDKYRR